MVSETERKIRERVTDYVSGRLSADDLHLWLTPLLWRIDRDTDLTAFQVASKIALYLSEYGAGHRTEQELRGLLTPLAASTAAQQ